MGASEADKAQAYMREAFAVNQGKGVRGEVERDGDSFGLVDFVMGLRRVSRKQAATYLSKKVYVLQDVQIEKTGRKQSMASVAVLKVVARRIGNDAAQRFLDFVEGKEQPDPACEAACADDTEEGTRVADVEGHHLLPLPAVDMPEEDRRAYDAWYMEEPFDDLVRRLAGEKYCDAMLRRIEDLVGRKHRYLCLYAPFQYVKADGTAVVGLSRKSKDWAVPFVKARIALYPDF